MLRFILTDFVWLCQIKFNSTYLWFVSRIKVGVLGTFWGDVCELLWMRRRVLVAFGGLLGSLTALALLKGY